MSQGEPTKEGAGRRRGPVDVRCEVRAVDLDARRFVARLADGHTFEGHFPERFAVEFQLALGSAGGRFLHIMGEGVFSEGEDVLQVVSGIDFLRIEREDAEEKPGRTLASILEESWGSAAESDLEAIPTDLSVNVDHYLYGHEKEVS